MTTVTPELQTEINRIAAFYKDVRGYNPPYYLYAPFQFEEKEIITPSGIVKTHFDKHLPIGTIYVLSRKMH